MVLGTLVGTLVALGVRDWRIYGITVLWPPVIDAYQTANVTLPLALLVAVTWRFRDRPGPAGRAFGFSLALKFLLWPVAIWLVAIGRIRAAGAGIALAFASLLLLLPFTSIGDYARLVRNLTDTFDGLSCTTFAVLVDLDAPEMVARAVTRLS